MIRPRVITWALWDCGATGLNAIVVTFVFSVYLTGTVGDGLPGGTSPASWLGRALTVSAVFVALLAPLTGVLVAAPHRRRVVLTALTALAAVFTAAMSFIGDDPRYLFPGLVLLALTFIVNTLAEIIRQRLRERYSNL
jgi:UMF1 family MFS transporter